MTDDSMRIDALDFLRGLAVMGILLANIVAFALPSSAQLSPFTLGADNGFDMAAWAFNFVLVDGKFRALFAIMFGASMLLVMESAEMDGRDGMAAHRRRMIWLLVIGLAHHLLVWSGDILLPLALAGLIAARLARCDTLTLVKWALGFLALQWVIDIAVTSYPFWLRSAASAPGATSTLVAQWRAFSDALGGQDSALVTDEIAQYRAGYGAIVAARIGAFGQDMANVVAFGLLELLAFMAFGMAMLKGGFLSGQWLPEQYAGAWRRALLVGLIPMAGLAAWVLLSGDALVAQVAGFAWSVPVRLPLAVAYAALAMSIALRFPDAMPARAVRAVGRLALSNYLLCSIAGTTLFYGYGGGLFGSVSRAGLMLFVLAGWVVMLGWSSLWRRRLRYGPAEWVWRRLARR